MSMLSSGSFNDTAANVACLSALTSVGEWVVQYVLTAAALPAGNFASTESTVCR